MRSPSAQPSMAMPAVPLSLPHCHAHIAPGRTWGFRAHPVRDRSPISEQLRQLGDVGGDAPSLIAGQQFGP